MFSPKGKSGGGATDLDSTLSLLGQDVGGESISKAPSHTSLANALKFEAAMFRPALQAARTEATMWKAKTIENKIASLPPLSVPNCVALANIQPQDGEESTLPLSSMNSNLLQCKEELVLAASAVRLAKAAVSVVDLTKSKSAGVSSSTATRSACLPSRRELREHCSNEILALQRLEDAKFSARTWLFKLSGNSDLGGAWLLPFEMPVTTS